MSDKKKLPVLGKSLVPELLPAPPLDAAASSPRERVRARMRELVERAALAAVTGLAAASSCGYDVVDPLPPPVQAASGSGANLCPRPNALSVRVLSARWQAMTVQLDLQVQNVAEHFKPRLSGATSEAPIHVLFGADGHIELGIEKAWPSSIELSLSYECFGTGGLTSYLVRLWLDTSRPADSGDLPAQIL